MSKVKIVSLNDHWSVAMQRVNQALQDSHYGRCAVVDYDLWVKTREIASLVVDTYEGDGMEGMRARDHVMYEAAKEVLG